MAIVTVKSADDVRIEQIGGAVTMKGWLWCEMRNRCEQQQAEIERLLDDNDQKDGQIDWLEAHVSDLQLRLDNANRGNDAALAEAQVEIERLTRECRRLRIACGPSEMIESDYIPDGEGGD